MPQKYVPGQIIIAFKDSALGTAPPGPNPRPLIRRALLLLANVRFKFSATRLQTLLHLGAGVRVVDPPAAIPGPLTPALQDFATVVSLMDGALIPDYSLSTSLIPDARKLILVKLPAGNVSAALDYVRKFPSLIEYAERVPIRFFSPVAGEPAVNPPWSYDAIGLSDEVRRDWNHEPIYNIAVLDSGIDTSHEAVRNHVLPAYPTAATDEWGHGTAVSSIISSQQLPSSGAPPNLRGGLLHASKILMYKVADHGVKVTGITFPVDFGLYLTVVADLTAKRLALTAVVGKTPDGRPVSFQIRVLNMSFGGPACSFTETAILRKAYEAGLHLVACAGNRDGGMDDSTDVWFPAALSSVTAVSALGYNRKLWPSAKYTNPYQSGKVAVDLAAPGESILGAWPMQGASLITKSTLMSYRFSIWLEGSSFAAPFVTAASSVLFHKEENNSPTAKIIQDKLRSGFTKDLNETGLGNGVLDVETLKP